MTLIFLKNILVVILAISLLCSSVTAQEKGLKCELMYNSYTFNTKNKTDLYNQSYETGYPGLYIYIPLKKSSSISFGPEFWHGEYKYIYPDNILFISEIYFDEYWISTPCYYNFKVYEKNRFSCFISAGLNFNIWTKQSIREKMEIHYLYEDNNGVMQTFVQTEYTYRYNYFLGIDPAKINIGSSLYFFTTKKFGFVARPFISYELFRNFSAGIGFGIFIR